MLMSSSHGEQRLRMIIKLQMTIPSLCVCLQHIHRLQLWCGQWPYKAVFYLKEMLSVDFTKVNSQNRPCDVAREWRLCQREIILTIIYTDEDKSHLEFLTFSLFIFDFVWFESKLIKNFNLKIRIKTKNFDIDRNLQGEIFFSYFSFLILKF